MKLFDVLYDEDLNKFYLLSGSEKETDNVFLYTELRELKKFKRNSVEKMKLIGNITEQDRLVRLF